MPSEGRVQTCWLCLGRGGIAIHEKWTKARDAFTPNAYPLWTAHEYPSKDPHPVRPCPVCSVSAPARNDR